MASMGKSRKTYFSTCGRRCRSKTGGGVTVYPTTKLSKYEGGAVRITYDRHTDTLSLVLKEGAAVAESDEGRPGVVVGATTRAALPWRPRAATHRGAS